MNVADRLKKERIRLKLSQTELGNLLGKGKTTVINWEKSVGAPDAVQLSVLQENNFDVNYIVTGVRFAEKPYETGGTSARLVARQELLSEREHALLDDFRALGDKEKDAAETMLHAAAQSQVKKKKA